MFFASQNDKTARLFADMPPSLSSWVRKIVPGINGGNREYKEYREFKEFSDASFPNFTKLIRLIKLIKLPKTISPHRYPTSKKMAFNGIRATP